MPHTPPKPQPQPQPITGWDTGALLQNCDPYLVWSDARAAGADRSEALCVLVELQAGVDEKQFDDWINAGAKNRAEDQFIPLRDTSMTLPFLAGLVKPAGLDRLKADVAGPQSHVLRFTLQESRRRFRDAVQENAAITFDKEKAQQADKAAEAAARHPCRPVERAGGHRHTAAALRQGVFLGIIDDGMPALWARDLLGGTAPQSVYLWDQSWWPRHAPQPPGGAGRRAGPWPYWKSARWESDTAHDPGFLYGRRLAATTDTADEAAVYRAMRYHTPAPRHTHGAAVLGLMVPTLVPRPAGSSPTPCLPPHVAGLAMVQLLGRTVEDTAGGSLAARVLDALQYVLWQEAHDRDFTGTARPTVVNLSYGIHGGPHDGSSMFERALKVLLDANPHLHLVLPAGNSHRLGCHWHAEVPAHGKSTATVQVLPDNPADTFVEIWLPAGAVAVSVTVTSPGGHTTTVRRGEARRLDVPSHGLEHALIFPTRAAQSPTRTLVLLAIGATRVGPAPQPRAGGQGLVQGTAGRWTLTIHNDSGQPLKADAWIERGDAAPDHAGGNRQAYFPDSETAPAGNAEPTETRNGLGTLRHDRLKVIGALQADGHRIADYSAAGTDTDPPDALAVADWSPALPGVRTGGFASGTVTRVNGTSAASAVYARAWAQALAATLPAGIATTPLPTPRPAPMVRPEWPPGASEAARGGEKVADTSASGGFHVGFYP